jgi:hypothetical protein
MGPRRTPRHPSGPKELEKENARLKRLLAEKELAIDILMKGSRRWETRKDLVCIKSI